MQRLVRVSEGGQEPSFSKRNIENLFLLGRETDISLLLLLPPQLSMFLSLGIQHHGQSPESPGGTVSCQQLPRERLPGPALSHFPLSSIISVAGGLSVPLGESHVAFRKSLARGVDRTPLACLARSRPKQERAYEKGLLLPILSSQAQARGEEDCDLRLRVL